jgi:uncharacterized protein YjiS (DUF1127 family)
MHVINIFAFASGRTPMADISLHFSSKAPLAGTFTAFSQIFQTWRRRAHDRQELAKLDQRSLHDLGLSEGSARFEANKPFWRD